MYWIPFHLQRMCQKKVSVFIPQNEVGFCHSLSDVQHLVAETQEDISRVFPTKLSFQISTYSKTRGAYFFASTACHTRQLSSPHSTVSIIVWSLISPGNDLGNKFI